MKILLFFSFLCLAYGASLRKASKEKDVCNLDPTLVKEIAGYQPTVDKIVRELTQGRHKGKTFQALADFVDTFGNRISGTQNLENAIDYMMNKSVENNLENVHGEPVTVPHWVRGHEEAKMLLPFEKPLNMLGLGGSIATPSDGITAEAIVVKDFNELKRIGDKAKGKIVVYNEKWVNYGVTVQYRTDGAVEAAKVGAVASLIRSVTPFSINSPHTGMQSYNDNVTRIPTACITVEDAAMLQRMQDRGQNIKIFLKMEAKNEAPVVSRNTVVEVTGQTEPENVVLLSGHLDSWDVGMGAMDDGGGAFISWYSTVVLKSLGLRPKRTVRTVMWTGEEEGLIGATEYRKAHMDDNDHFTLLMESDIGTFTPQGITFGGVSNPEAGCIIQEILKLFSGLNATQYEPSNDIGSDIMVWFGDNIPLASLKNADEKYFWFHHSNGDTLTVEDSEILDKCTAVWASTAFVVADLSVNLPR